jgi:hypothetical protein
LRDESLEVRERFLIDLGEVLQFNEINPAFPDSHLEMHRYVQTVTSKGHSVAEYV